MSKQAKKEKLRILEIDPWLEGQEDDLKLRISNYHETKERLLDANESLSSFANAHKYYGIHRQEDGSWIYREWAPKAHALFLVGDFNDWDYFSHPLENIGNGDWEIKLEADQLAHGQAIKVNVQFDYEDHLKIPIYARYVTQEIDDNGNSDFVARVWAPEEEYEWQSEELSDDAPPLIYEAHVGIASEAEEVATYRHFADEILPRIKENGYNAIQLMAVMQHPYYGSFGYHVSNFFAASSWFGTPDDLKYLVDKAHSMGLRVIMDIVHSHAVKNTNEGINRFDGSNDQFFYPDQRGFHTQWDSMVFNYGKDEVIHFLLSNVKFWLEEYRFDGFRFDGVTSMLYWDHGIGSAFDSYDKYFSLNTNTEAVTYLMLAAETAKEVAPQSLLIAEDMSGMPGLCLPIEDGGMGFDYRLSMGVPDMWIRLLKSNDYDWNMNMIYHELTTHRPYEKRIAYAESHDQALVGDKTIMFRLADADMYWHMSVEDDHYNINRALALHKMIRLVTLATGPDGYLNFMGNEFGHPEWIDFPREGNNWSFYYARRQWSLVDNEDLKYKYLNHFDQGMLSLIKEDHLIGPMGLQVLWLDNSSKLMAFRNNDYVFFFNFHPENSYESFQLPLHQQGDFQVVFSTDRGEYGGYDRISEEVVYHSHELPHSDGSDGIEIYSPSRTAMVLKKIN